MEKNLNNENDFSKLNDNKVDSHSYKEWEVEIYKNCYKMVMYVHRLLSEAKDGEGNSFYVVDRVNQAYEPTGRFLEAVAQEFKKHRYEDKNLKPEGRLESTDDSYTYNKVKVDLYKEALDKLQVVYALLFQVKQRINALIFEAKNEKTLPSSVTDQVNQGLKILEDYIYEVQRRFLELEKVAGKTTP